jgi:hypothetical protein
MRTIIALMAAVSGLLTASLGSAEAATFTFDAQTGGRKVEVLLETFAGRKDRLHGDISSLFIMTVADEDMRYTLGGPSGGPAFLDWRQDKLIFVTTDTLRQHGFGETVTLSFTMPGSGSVKNAAAFFRRLSRAEAEFQGLLPAETVPVPLPGALPLFLAGAALGGVALRRRRRRV